jgi:hypothetical protein
VALGCWRDEGITHWVKTEVVATAYVLGLPADGEYLIR